MTTYEHALVWADGPVWSTLNEHAYSLAFWGYQVSAGLRFRRIMWAIRHGRHRWAYWPYLGAYECLDCHVMEPLGRL